MSPTVAAPVIVVVAVVAIDSCVYSDAKAHAERGAPVVFRLGSFVVDTPTAWFLACLLMWVIFFLLYLSNRN